jgi:hypothetical protein
MSRQTKKERYEGCRKYRLALKKKVFTHYFGEYPACKCGMDDLRVLSLHHVEGGGEQHRRELMGQSRSAGTHFYRALLKAGLPDVKFEAICANCHVLLRYLLPITGGSQN